MHIAQTSGYLEQAESRRSCDLVEYLRLTEIVAAVCRSSAATQNVRVREDAIAGNPAQTHSRRATCLARHKPRSDPADFNITLSAVLSCKTRSTDRELLASQSG